ncbi:MAG: hypothetical protein AB7F64_04400 [Gammaproteobacteria bacterium]
MLNNDESRKMIDSVEYYLLNGKAPSPFWFKQSFIKELVNKLTNLAPALRAEYIQIIDIGIQAAKKAMYGLQNDKKNSVGQRIAQFKISISGICNGWKSKLHNDQLLTVEKIHWHSISYNNSASQIIQPTETSRFFRTQRNINGSQLLQGTSFLTNRETLLGTQNMHVLDAAFSAYLLNDERTPYAALLALGDGCGGHFGEEKQDRAISRTAYFSCKQALRLMATTTSPEECLQSIPHLLANLKNEIKIKTDGFREGTTLLAVRTFPMENGMHRLVGFNIGDSLLAGYDFAHHQITTLSPAHVQMLELSQSEATANFPTSYQDIEIRLIDRIVSPTMHLIAMSDGIYDYLPTKQETGQYPNRAKYQSTLLDAEAINKELNNPENTEQLHNRLFNLAIRRLEIDRQNKLAEATEAKISLEEKQTQFQENFNQIIQSLNQLENSKDSTRDDNKIAELKSQQKKIREEWESLQAAQVIQLGDDVTLIGLSLPNTSHHLTVQNHLL